MRIAIYPGSFDPITNGHLDIISRAAKIFDEVIILVAENTEKKYRFSSADRKMMVKVSTKELKNVEVDSYDGLTMDYARKVGAIAMIRGLRVVSDFEYEWKLAAANEFVNPEIETVFLMAHKATSFISSSTINMLYENGVDVSPLVPPIVVEMLDKRKRQK
jgi:pantetheine-phosphate adenylyltransferase